MSNHWKTRLRMTSSSRESYTYAVRQNRWDPWIFIPSPLENSSRTQRSAGKAAGFLWDCEFPGMSHWFSQHQASTSNKTYLYIYIYYIYIDMLHMYVWLYMLYSICYILPMSHHVIPDCIPMSYPWHEAARRGAARLAARWPQKRRCNVHCCAVIQIPKRRCGDVAMWRFFWGFSPWKVGQLLGDPEKLGKLHRVHGLAKALCVGAGPSWISRRDFTIKAAPCSPFPWYPAKVHDSVIVTIMELYG